MTIPTSSSSSRTAAPRAVSPGSIWPPMVNQYEWAGVAGSCPRRRRTRPRGLTGITRAVSRCIGSTRVSDHGASAESQPRRLDARICRDARKSAEARAGLWSLLLDQLARGRFGQAMYPGRTWRDGLPTLGKGGGAVRLSEQCSQRTLPIEIVATSRSPRAVSVTTTFSLLPRIARVTVKRERVALSIFMPRAYHRNR